MSHGLISVFKTHNTITGNMTATKAFILVIAFMLICSTAAWTNMANRLKDLVIHIESRREGFEKNWVIRSAYHDAEWSYYSKFTQYSDYEVYSAENTKWLVSLFFVFF